MLAKSCSTKQVRRRVPTGHAPRFGIFPIRRHPADTFVYVLEGAIEMQVAGGPLTRLKAGEAFYESPQDQHIVSRNASRTEKAKFLVFFVKGKDTSVLEPLTP